MSSLESQGSGISQSWSDLPQAVLLGTRLSYRGELVECIHAWEEPLAQGYKGLRGQSQESNPSVLILNL